ncbi:MAG: polyisoprenoid-binding protein [Ignavibacteriae bacterium]|nr:polyisoprenoid-binding protein [Ignavibacteriota bacterium]
MKHAILATLIFAFASTNAQTAWKLDKAHSQVNFMVNHMVFSEVAGTFKDFDATFNSTKDDFTDAKIEATIKTGSIDTQNEQRDGHLKKDDFLNVEQYPLITFKSTKIEKTGDDTYAITGTLTIRDVTKPVVMETAFKGSINDPWGNTRIAFKATTTINRFDFDVRWNKMLDTGGLVAGKDVNVILLMEFTKPKAG